LILLSFVIASPVTYYFMHKWLNDFVYRTRISWWVFAVAGILAIFIGLVSVSSQAIKAAIANPVKSLRAE
jgi:putative ABC transport system permease protein